MPHREHFRTPESQCPGCNHALDSVAPDPSAPRDRAKPGDLTICFYCGSILIFGEDLRVRFPTHEEKVEVIQDPGIYRPLQAAQQQILLQLKTRGRKN